MERIFLYGGILLLVVSGYLYFSADSAKRSATSETMKAMAEGRTPMLAGHTMDVEGRQTAAYIGGGFGLFAVVLFIVLRLKDTQSEKDSA